MKLLHLKILTAKQEKTCFIPVKFCIKTISHLNNPIKQTHLCESEGPMRVRFPGKGEPATASQLRYTDPEMSRAVKDQVHVYTHLETSVIGQVNQYTQVL